MREDLGDALGNHDSSLWAMENGYALASGSGLLKIRQCLQKLNDTEREDLKGKLRIGLQWNTEVTLSGAGHLVSQAYCSALPVAYSQHPSATWEPFARLVLEASYEALLHAAIINKEQTGRGEVYLTLLGGGAYGNPIAWILDAIRCALERTQHSALKVSMVSHSHPDIDTLAFIEEMDAH